MFQSLQKALGCEIRSGCTLRLGAIQRLEALGLLPRGQRSTESRPRRAARVGWLAGECRGSHENLHLPQPTHRLGCQRSRSGFCLPEVMRELPIGGTYAASSTPEARVWEKRSSVLSPCGTRGGDDVDCPQATSCK